MAISLTITVADIAATIGAGYTHIKVYRSTEQTTGFAEITIASSRIVLQSGVSLYNYIDGTGTTKLWYKTTFLNNATDAETTLAATTAFLGTFTDLKFTGRTYPLEYEFTSDDYYVIDRIRLLIGDPKELARDYLSEATGGFDDVSADGKTVSLSNPSGWPLVVKHNLLEYTIAADAPVQDFQYITISGTVDISSGTTDILDIWYYHFRFSDSEILVAYNGLNTPPPLENTDVTFDLAAICTAIELLGAESRLAGVTSSSAVNIFQEISINPKGGLDSRQKDLAGLEEKKQALIDAILADKIGNDAAGGITGVLID